MNGKKEENEKRGIRKGGRIILIKGNIKGRKDIITNGDEKKNGKYPGKAPVTCDIKLIKGRSCYIEGASKWRHQIITHGNETKRKITMKSSTTREMKLMKERSYLIKGNSQLRQEIITHKKER